MSYRRTLAAIAASSLVLAACERAVDKASPEVAPARTAGGEVAPPDTDRVARTDSIRADSIRADSVRADSVRRAAATRDTARRLAGDSAARDTTPRPIRKFFEGTPAPLPGAILPARRIVAYYGNPLSTRMGILGELPPQQMLARLDQEVERWRRADPATPVQPALHLIVVVAQGAPGRDGKYRLRMTDSLIERVHGWARQRNAILFLDVQVGLSTLREELPRLTTFLSRPDVHLGIDPEFSMKTGAKPGTRVGTYDAADINYAQSMLADLVRQHNLPPKVLVIHRFTRRMVTNYRQIRPDPRVQVVMHMDGWGRPSLKIGTYRNFIMPEPVQYTGFKIFYKNDLKQEPHRLMTPADLLRLDPQPMYIQYQ